MKPRPWMPASEAAKVLRERGVNPVEALSTLIRETGHSGVNRLWAVGNKITIRNGTTLWLTSPEIDVDVGTIIVPQRAVGRRIPEDRPEPLLINPYELDRRWPRPSAGGTGRPLSYDPEAFEDALALEVSKRGLPSRDNEDGWRTQADVVRWANEFLEARQEELGETQTKSLVRATLTKLSNI